MRKDTAGGFIPGAVALSHDQLEGRKGDFPKQKNAPVIVYGGGEEAAAAFAVVRGWGYKNASILGGGVDAWVSAGNSLDGAAKEKITYVPKPRPGEMPVAEFRKAADSPSPGVVILDVRGADETSQGMIKGALNIPLTELEERVGDIPKDKKIVAQCNTGAQAEMAYNLLRESGFDAAWLNAKITITADGTYTIEDN